MKLSDYGLEIRRVRAGFILKYPNELGKTWEEFPISDSDNDRLRSMEELLWEVLEYFGSDGSKHDPERLRIVREKKK